MAIQRQGRPTHFVSPNKRIRLWHCRLAHISDGRVVRASMLVDGIQLGYDDNKKYDPTEVFINLDDSDVCNVSNSKEPLTMPFGMEAIPIIVVCQTKIEDPDIFDKLYIPCVGSKLTRIVR